MLELHEGMRFRIDAKDGDLKGAGSKVEQLPLLVFGVDFYRILREFLFMVTELGILLRREKIAVDPAVLSFTHGCQVE